MKPQNHATRSPLPNHPKGTITGWLGKGERVAWTTLG